MNDRSRAEQFMDIFGFEIDNEAYNADCTFTKLKDNEVALEFVIPDKGVLTEYNGGRGGIHNIALEVDDVGAGILVGFVERTKDATV